MTKRILFLMLISLQQGCLDMTEEKIVQKYKTNDSTLITLRYVGGGATAPDYLQISKGNLSTSKTIIVKNLMGFTNDHLFHFQKIDDSILLFKIIDTAKFSVGERELNFRININEIDTSFNKYKSEK